MISQRSQKLALAAALMSAAALRFWGLAFGLPHTETRPDESTIIVMAIRFWKDGFAPLSLVYPTLFTYLLSGIYGIYALLKGTPGGIYQTLMGSYVASPDFFFITARILSAMSGVATVFACWLIGNEIDEQLEAKTPPQDSPRLTGIIAAFFMAFCYLHARDSHFGALDAAMTLFIALSAYYALKIMRTKAVKDYILCGVFAGLATGTKYAGILLIFQAFAAHFLSSERKNVFDRKIAFFIIALLGAFFVTTPFLFLDFSRTLADYRYHQSLHGFMTGGDWFYHIRFTLYKGLGMPLFLCSLAGFALMFWRHWRRAAVIFAFAAVYFFVLARTHSAFARYCLPLLPFCCIAAGYMVASAQKLRRWGWLALLAVVIGDGALNIARFDMLLSKEDSRARAARELEIELPASSKICQTGNDYTNLQLNWDKDYLAFRADEAAKAGATIKSALYSAKLERANKPHGYIPVYYNSAARAFADYAGNPSEPDYVIMPQPPFGAEIATGLDEILAQKYSLYKFYDAFTPESANSSYDIHDASYIPFGCVHGVNMPGPNIYVFKRN